MYKFLGVVDDVVTDRNIWAQWKKHFRIAKGELRKFSEYLKGVTEADFEKFKDSFVKNVVEGTRKAYSDGRISADGLEKARRTTIINPCETSKLMYEMYKKMYELGKFQSESKGKDEAKDKT
ncbi:MAG: hypothetical protein LBB18_01965 [Puniceicoccales bacterium]|jgi:hypothetical protein|nr:hypothetical protein [Puniceicoccales bacterium]